MRRSGFTLIELLIVVAIIAILAAIAVPNFLEAQTRSKVSRTKADLRTVATALESYRIDNNVYPIIADLPEVYRIPDGGNLPTETRPCYRSRAGLTSPVAYLTSIPPDAFGPTFPDDEYRFGGTVNLTSGYYYSNLRFFTCMGFGWGVFPTTRVAGQSGTPAQWVLLGKGPDKYFSNSAKSGIGVALEVDNPYPYEYDPTNGTISVGNIIRSGP
jgi:type II secretion system protein G